MKIYAHFGLKTIRLRINGEEFSMPFSKQFYNRTADGSSYIMFYEEQTSQALQDFVKKFWNELSWMQKIKHHILCNSVYVLIDKAIEEWVNIEQLYAYATIFLDGREVYLICQPSTFDPRNLEGIEDYTDQAINIVRRNDQLAISKLK